MYHDIYFSPLKLFESYRMLEQAVMLAIYHICKSKKPELHSFVLIYTMYCLFQICKFVYNVLFINKGKNAFVDDELKALYTIV